MEGLNGTADLKIMTLSERSQTRKAEGGTLCDSTNNQGPAQADWRQEWGRGRR